MPAHTLRSLRQQIGTVASHRLARAQPKLFSAVPKYGFQATGEQGAAAAVEVGSSSQLPTVPNAVPRRSAGRGWGTHDSLTLVKHRHVAAGTHTTVLTERGFLRHPAPFCHRQRLWEHT